MRVCYHVVLVNGTSSSSPKTLFQVVADSVWVSIAVGPDDELYLAWTETSRVGSTHIGSKALYAKLDAKDGLAESAITLLAHTNDTLRVMEAASSRDRMSLHLAWIEQFLETSSRIVYSRIDVSQNSSVMMSVGEVNGTISRFTMTSTLDGEVAIAWAYNEPSRGGSSARIVRVSRSGDMSAAELQIQRREMTELRYLTFDPKGNLCLLWTDLVEDVGHGRRPLRVRQPSLYLEKFNEAGQLSEETTTVAYVPVVATFVLEDGQLYVISEGEVVETATPSILGKSTVFFVALALLACTVSGVSTEAGTYVVASRLGAFQWESRCLRGRSASICRRLLRKIRERPGIMLSELKAISSDSISDIAFHLRMLENLQVIHSLSEGTKRRFYYVGEDDSDQPRSAELRKLIIRLLNEKPGLSEAQIARSLAISQQLANYHLRTLAKARLLSRTRDPSKVSYFVNARLLSRTDDVA
jgi:predicted transcriptional regulator